ncbi:hypothetical protein FHL15_010012 [Xylaria flabelliformis]|uniref:Uncharacterized protein n=1 Tax=Xylaria flabelliformis TaxID=2512241 RepID=A0A553HMA5_9PEZI|nr:hypothetical protein FHL15_010012 [Xylaria flabelliformis]
MPTAWAYVNHTTQDPGYRQLSVSKKVVVMEVVGAIASFIAIGQAIGVTPKIIKALKGFTNASEEIEALIDELESLYGFYQHMKANIDLFSGEHNTALLRVDEPPYFKLIRRDFESLIAALQELADSCLIDEDGATMPPRDTGISQSMVVALWIKYNERAAARVRILLSGNTWEDFRLVKLTASDKYHLTEFLRFMDMEDDHDLVFDWARAANFTQNLSQMWSNTPDILTKRDGHGNTVLHYACQFDNVALVQHLPEFDALLNVTNIFGSTPLFSAIISNAWSSAELLVERGCQLNIANNNGNTPLFIAIQNINSGESRAIRFAKMLMSRGADLRVIGRAVWHRLSRIKSHTADLWELYEMISRSGGARSINMSTNDGITPLMQAIHVCNIPLALFLRKLGARLDAVSPIGSNILHTLALYGDEQSCDLAAKLKISCVDIRTTDNYRNTPLTLVRVRTIRYSQASGDFMSYPEFLTPDNYTEDEPGKREYSQPKLIAFERLLRDIRDRMLVQEIAKLELIILKLRARSVLSARDDIRELDEGKVKAKIYHEAETFRAIDLDVREGRLELAIESLEEFIEVSRDRMQVSPFDEEVWDLSDSESENSEAVSEDESESASEAESGGEHDTDWNSSEGDEGPQDNEYGDDEDGWETADEGR